MLTALMLLCGCNIDTADNTPESTDAVYPPDVHGKLSDEPLTLNRHMSLQYANGSIYAIIGRNQGECAYPVRYNCTSGRISTVCPDPLCLHENEECPLIGIQQCIVLPDGRVCYSQKFDHIYRNDAGVIIKEVHIFDHALFDPIAGKKTVLYEYDGSYFTGPELYTDNYRFYHSIEYDEERELFVTGLYRMNLKNGDIKLLLEHGTSEKDDAFNVSSEMIGIFNERIYLSDGLSIFSIDFEGEKRITHLEGKYPVLEPLHADGEYVYYQREDGVYRQSLSSGKEEHIVKCNNIYGNFTLTTNWIYYQAGDTITIGKVDIDGYAAREAELSGGEIYRCTHDGSELTKIAEMNGEYAHLRPNSMTVAGEYIYATYTGWQDKNGDSIFTRDEQLASGYSRTSLQILRIDTTSGEITTITLK